eukprot:327337-Chlamydomonas_euryale.AAC.2
MWTEGFVGFGGKQGARAAPERTYQPRGGLSPARNNLYCIFASAGLLGKQRAARGAECAAWRLYSVVTQRKAEQR